MLTLDPYSKHQKNHKKPTHCEVCPKTFAERKDKIRHMTTNHPNESAALGIEKDERPCPLCSYKGRGDNLKRHVEKLHAEVAEDYYPPKQSTRKGKEKRK